MPSPDHLGRSIRGTDFLAVAAGGQVGRTYKTQDDGLRSGRRVSCLTYQEAPSSRSRSGPWSNQAAADAVFAGLGEALRWHAECGQPLLLTRHDAPSRATDRRQRMPLTFVIGRDVP